MNKLAKYWAHLLFWDSYFLFKYQLLSISLLITLLYWAVFMGLKSLGPDTLLILVLYNDPILLGMLFGGLMMIMDRNQFTVAALAVTPLPVMLYIGSKLIILTILGLSLSLLLFYLVKGEITDPILFSMNIVLISSFFSILGFVIGFRQTQYLRFIIQIIGLFMLLNIPFLGYFNMLPKYATIWMPIGLSLELFNKDLNVLQTTVICFGLFGWNILVFLMLLFKIQRNGWA